MNKNISIGVLLVIVIILGVWVLQKPAATNLSNESPATSTVASTTSNEVKLDNEVQISTPKAGAVVASPISVVGKARGGWFFEANLPLKVLDANGKVVGTGNAMATGEWMTSEFVPFKGEIKYQVAQDQEGVLVIAKDNPSGLPQNDKEVRLPVKLVAGSVSGEMTVKVYFSSKKLDPNTIDCGKTYSVERKVAKTVEVAKAAMTELLKGPSTTETADKYFTSINSGVTVRSLKIENGVAKIDLSSKIEEGLGGSCKVNAVRSQIENTLKQFPTVKSVVISVNGGNPAEALQP
ncbi:MAG: GerMN domain-containing protein [bacterium]